MPNLRAFYLDVMNGALKRQAGDGPMPSGHNGHYNDLETPVRNTSHYLIAFIRAWELSGDESFRLAAVKCLDWLVSANPHRQAHTYHHRTKLGKDQCNGLIGPAWNIEALIYASSRLERDDARAMAEELFLLHPFDEKLGIWNRVEPDGSVLSYDATFNHQLWFAASAAPLAASGSLAKDRIGRFMLCLSRNWLSADNGRVIHPLGSTKRRLRELVKRQLKSAYRREMVSKEIGYHSFNLYAFAMLFGAKVEWQKRVNDRVMKAVAYLEHPEFVRGIDKALCGFPYNPPGWEIPVILSAFDPKDTTQRCNKWFNAQLSHSYDSETKRLSRNTSDPETQTARIYELARLPDAFFDIEL